MFILASSTIYLLILKYWGLFSDGKSDQSMKPTIPFHQAPELKMCGVTPPVIPCMICLQDDMVGHMNLYLDDINYK
jgi:hypothetical protein